MSSDEGTGSARNHALVFAGLSAISYCAVLSFVFPGYLAPLAAHHADMYIPADAAARGFTLVDAFAHERPIAAAIGIALGHLGFEASVAAYIVVTVLTLAAVMGFGERWIVRAPIPWWAALAAFTFAMAAPAFYFDAGYDLGTCLAIGFGLGGMWLAQARRPVGLRVGTLIAALFVLSALSKESFLPVLGVFALYMCWRTETTTDRLIIGGAVATGGVAVLIDATLVHSLFIHTPTAGADPYTINVAPASLMAGAAFYLDGYADPFVAGFIVACAAIAIARGRCFETALLLASGIAMLVPYVVLPNHRLGYYQWAPIPALMLLVPLAWTPEARSERAIGSWFSPRWLGIRLTLGIFLAAALVRLHLRDLHDGAWSLAQQDINRNLIQAVRAAPISAAQSVAVCGIAFPFHPWQHAAALRYESHFAGRWIVLTEPGVAPIGAQSNAVAGDYAQVDWTHVDDVLVVAGDGTLRRMFSGRRLADFMRSEHITDARRAVEEFAQTAV